MAKKSTSNLAASRASQPASLSGRLTHEEKIAAELFVRSYQPNGGYTVEHAAEEAIRDAKTFLSILHR